MVNRGGMSDNRVVWPGHKSQPLSQPDSGRHTRLNLMENDNGDYSYSKRLHKGMARTLIKE